MNGQTLSYASGFIRRFVREEKEFPLKSTMGNQKWMSDEKSIEAQEFMIYVVAKDILLSMNNHHHAPSISIKSLKHSRQFPNINQKNSSFHSYPRNPPPIP